MSPESWQPVTPSTRPKRTSGSSATSTPFAEQPDSEVARPQRRHYLRRILSNRQVWLAIAGIVVAIGFWQLLWQSGRVPEYMLPSPRQVARTWIDLWRVGVMWHHVRATLVEALLGFAVALVIGVGLGYPLARSRVMDEILAPYLAASQAMPVIAFAPLLVVWFGLGLLPKVIICTLIVFFPILINTVVGFRSIDPDMRRAAQGLGANGLRTFWYVEVPLALRTLLGGIKMGLTLSVAGAVVAEFVASDAGLGYLMNLGRTEYRSSIVFAAALTMALVGISGYVFVSILERVLIRWE